jgi:hypothetical protein
MSPAKNKQSSKILIISFCRPLQKISLVENQSLSDIDIKPNLPLERKNGEGEGCMLLKYDNLYERR